MPRLMGFPALKRLLAGACCLFASTVSAMDSATALAHFKRAHLEAEAGQTKQAQRRLEWLLREDRESPVRSKAYQVALSKLLQETPLSFSFTAGLSIADNPQRSSSADVFETDLGRFDIASDDDGVGFGLTLGADLRYRHAYSVGRIVEARLGATGLVHEFDALQYFKPEVRLSHIWQGAGRSYTVSAYQNAGIYPDLEGRDDPDYRALGISAMGRSALGQGRSVSGFLRLEDRQYQELDHLTGQTYGLGGSYVLPTPVGGRVTVSGQLARADLTAAHYSYWSVGGSVAYADTTAGGLSWSLGAGQTWRDYDGLFTALSYAREDREARVFIGLSHEDIHFNALQPRLNCSYSKQTSNVALFQNDGVSCSVRVNHRF